MIKGSSRRLSSLALGAAAALLLLAIWVLVDNQSIHVSAVDRGDARPAGSVGCSVAPYDAGFYGNDQAPGGEHARAYAAEVSAECYSVNVQRFRMAMIAGGAALVLLLVAIAVAWGGRRADISAGRHDAGVGGRGGPQPR